jgi:hypothetical protein
MKTITSLDQIKKLPGKIYVRWSKSIALDNKRGYSLRYGREAEAGLSCCVIDQTWEDWRILRQLQEYQFLGGSCWIVTGELVGVGGDDEPVLRNLVPFGKVSTKLTSANWRKMELELDISDAKDRLTRITDEIGRRIVLNSINEYQAKLTEMESDF